jgi:hypothetical protein
MQKIKGGIVEKPFRRVKVFHKIKEQVVKTIRMTDRPRSASMISIRLRPEVSPGGAGCARGLIR